MTSEAIIAATSRRGATFRARGPACIITCMRNRSSGAIQVREMAFPTAPIVAELYGVSFFGPFGFSSADATIGVRTTLDNMLEVGVC